MKHVWVYLYYISISFFFVLRMSTKDKSGSKTSEKKWTKHIIFQVEYAEGVGRYLVAARDIAPLELVLWDKEYSLTRILCVQKVLSIYI